MSTLSTFVQERGVCNYTSLLLSVSIMKLAIFYQLAPNCKYCKSLVWVACCCVGGNMLMMIVIDVS